MRFACLGSPPLPSGVARLFASVLVCSEQKALEPNGAPRSLKLPEGLNLKPSKTALGMRWALSAAGTTSHFPLCSTSPTSANDCSNKSQNNRTARDVPPITPSSK